jgi:hypothetical protein
LTEREKLTGGCNFRTSWKLSKKFLTKTGLATWSLAKRAAKKVATSSASGGRSTGFSVIVVGCSCDEVSSAQKRDEKDEGRRTNCCITI